MSGGLPPWGPRPGAGPPMQQGQPMRPGGPGPPGSQWLPQGPPQMGGPPGAGPPGPPGQQPWNRGPPPHGLPRPPFPGGQGPPHPAYAPPQRPLFPAGMAQPPARPDMYRPPPQQAFSGPPGPGGMPPAHMMAQQPARPYGGPGGQLPGTPATPATPGAEASPRTQPKSAWTEHTAPDGRKYFYNASTKTSSWTRPPELAQGGPAAAPEKKPEVQSDWKEFTAPDGRKYYYNRVTKQSKWQIPDELKAAQSTPKASTPVQVVKLEAQSPAAGANGAAASHAAAERKVEASLPEPKRPVVYATKEEAKEAFKELLASVGTASNASWDTTMRLIANDPRYEAFRTIGEKKACFNEYLQQRAKEEKEEARLRAKRAREDLFTLLELSPELRTGMRYSKAAALFEDEPRWQAVKDAREREQLFNEHMKERERKEKEARRAEARRRKAAFKGLLEATKSIRVDTTWRKAQTKLEGEEEYEALDKLDRLEVFQGHIRELEKRDKAEKEAEKAARRRAERKSRDAFRALLEAHKENGTITPKMRWKDYHSVVEAEEAFLAVAKNLSGSRPRELFEDALEAVEEAYLRSRSRLKDARELAVSADSSFDAFSASVDALGESDRELAAVPAPHRQLFFDEEMGLLREKAAKEAKRRRRAREDFQLLLHDTRRIKHDTSWVEAQPMLEKEPEYRALEAAEREALFTEHIEKLAAKRKEREAAEEEERERGREAKKARKSEEEGKEKPRKEKKEKRHKEKKEKKDAEKDKERSAEKAAKRRSHDSDDEKKSSKRRKKDRADGKGGESAEEGEL